MEYNSNSVGVKMKNINKIGMLDNNDTPKIRRNKKKEINKIFKYIIMTLLSLMIFMLLLMLTLFDLIKALKNSEVTYEHYATSEDFTYSHTQTVIENSSENYKDMNYVAVYSRVVYGRKMTYMVLDNEFTSKNSVNNFVNDTPFISVDIYINNNNRYFAFADNEIPVRFPEEHQRIIINILNNLNIDLKQIGLDYNN